MIKIINPKALENVDVEGMLACDPCGDTPPPTPSPGPGPTPPPMPCPSEPCDDTC